MKIRLSDKLNNISKLAVAVSGGSDSMALLHYMNAVKEKFSFSVIALNVEHGIRGNDSILDSEFVKSYCKKNHIPLISYSVNALDYAEKNKLSIEQSARELRYKCFFEAISTGKCDVIATAHHMRDNVETVLFNLFRGSGLKGVSGIADNFNGKIIRPFINLSKNQIEEYIIENNIPFVEDQSNFSDEYTRNFIRINILPKIKEIFPEAEKSIFRFSEIAKAEDEFLDEQAKSYCSFGEKTTKISLPCPKVLLYRAIILALKSVGLKKDWEQIHVDLIEKLANQENGTTINLPKNILAIKEYDKLVIYQNYQNSFQEANFFIGEKQLFGKLIKIEKLSIDGIDLKKGLFADQDKIPNTAIIRTKKDGDLFTKFGGGTKKLADYFTDKKIPLRLRNSLPLLCDENKVLVIFGVEISDAVKATNQTKNLIKFTSEEL